MLAVQAVRLGPQHALLGFALAICVAACTSLSKREQALELDDVWTANGLPCVAEKVDLPLNIRKRSGQLTATSLASKSCFAPGRTLWQAKLPAKTIVAADLPLTLAADLLLEDAPATGMLTLLSETRMILTTEQAVIAVTRGAELSGPAAGANAGTAGKPAEPGGTSGEQAAQQPAAAAAAGSDSGAGAGAGDPPASAAAGGSAGAAQSLPASGSGAAGSAGASAMGPSAGMPATQAGNAAPAAGNAAPPAAGSGGAAGAGGTAGAAGSLTHKWEVEDLKGVYWFCTMIESGCVCIDNAPRRYHQNDCLVKPTGCSYLLLGEEIINCQSWPANNPECVEEATRADAVNVERCPPP